MTIEAKDLIQNNIPVVTFQDTISTSIEIMQDAELSQITVLYSHEKNEVAGILFLEDIVYSDNTEALLTENNVRIHKLGIHFKQHIFEVARIFYENDLTILPVLDETMTYTGSIRLDHLFYHLSQTLSIPYSGSIIVLRRMMVDYSLAEIARICESNDIRIISSGLMNEEDSNALIITLKLDKSDLGGLINAFERYEYEVVTFYGDNSYKDYLNDRFDLLMKYIDM